MNAWIRLASAGLVLLVLAAFSSWLAYGISPGDWQGPAASLTATLVLAFMLLIAVIDRYFAILPEHPLPAWLPGRTSIVVILFFLGILLGHYVWS